MSEIVNKFREKGTPFQIGQTVYPKEYRNSGTIMDLDSMSEQALIHFSSKLTWVDFADVKEPE